MDIISQTFENIGRTWGTVTIRSPFSVNTKGAFQSSFKPNLDVAIYDFKLGNSSWFN
jgi:hypothetical protein